MFGRKIKHLLEIRDMTQADLVRATGIHRNTISDLINGKVTNTSTDTIIKIAKALRVSAAYFFAEHAYTPLEALDLPEEIKDFVKNLDSMDYLVLAKKLEETKIPAKDIETILSGYKEVMNRKTDK